MKFIHAADLHLGLRVTRFPPEANRRVREARFSALDRLRNAIRQDPVDFVLIAGDVFDDTHVDRTTVRRAWEVFESFPCPVYLISGNHDPLTVDSMWERSPWNETSEKVIFLRERRPVSLAGGVTLFPCPLTSKNSPVDPTAWIPPRESGDETIRIVLAHGSFHIREDLPADDHLIARDVARVKGLDYVALGHWHRRSPENGHDGEGRVFYSGVHEPMRFRDVGWQPYSRDLDVFHDDGRGQVLRVHIDGPGRRPVVTPIETGQLIWEEREEEVTSEQDVSRLIDELANVANPERRLLRLTLRGVVPAKVLTRLEELDAQIAGGESGILDRYLWGEMDCSELRVEPDEEELRDLIGEGVLSEVLHQLNEESASPDEQTSAVAREAIMTLYHLAQETRQ